MSYCEPDMTVRLSDVTVGLYISEEGTEAGCGIGRRRRGTWERGKKGVQNKFKISNLLLHASRLLSRVSRLAKKERKFVEWHVMQCNGLFTINYLMQCVDNWPLPAPSVSVTVWQHNGSTAVSG